MQQSERSDLISTTIWIYKPSKTTGLFFLSAVSPSSLKKVFVIEKVLRNLENIGKKAELYPLAGKRNLCGQPRRFMQARSVMDSVGPHEAEKKVTGGQRAGDLKTSTNNQRSCSRCKRFGHFAIDCTYSSPSAKKADPGVIATGPREGARKNSAGRVISVYPSWEGR
ncbi:hypothetical protein PoB_005812100 [Plakobranchus ocellatus]|uniref:CCHC-type domain-containing protein n=1 Tax=Plakobranchus ocellatus TaxID=259542 RepID=A0AAV4C8I8_9GAST|nr:hypothetical protein PoB_005812100 [Plakobranchus ocellatus]